MMKILSILLCFVLVFGIVNSVNTVYAVSEPISSRLTYVATVESSFYIDDNGEATIGVGFFAYPDLFSYAKINITLDKRVLLLFWNEVDTWSYTTEDDSHINEIIKSVNSGTYRVQIEYTIYGTNGESEVITDEITDSY